MKSRTTAQFRKAFAGLPEQVQRQTREAYRQFKQDPGHPSLRFKKVHPELPIYSARISKNYRAVGQLDGDTVVWFWLGSHIDYSLSSKDGDRIAAQHLQACNAQVKGISEGKLNEFAVQHCYLVRWERAKVRARADLISHSFIQQRLIRQCLCPIHPFPLASLSALANHL